MTASNGGDHCANCGALNDKLAAVERERDRYKREHDICQSILEKVDERAAEILKDDDPMLVFGESITGLVEAKAAALKPAGKGEPAEPTAFGLIATERARQIHKGWTPEHDDQHDEGELATMAKHLLAYRTTSPSHDPWNIGAKWGHDRLRCLTISGALIVAEIERHQRLATLPTPEPADGETAVADFATKEARKAFGMTKPIPYREGINALEPSLGLHEALNVYYVVDGYAAEIWTRDSAEKICEAKGASVHEALCNLAAIAGKGEPGDPKGTKKWIKRTVKPWDKPEPAEPSPATCSNCAEWLEKAQRFYDRVEEGAQTENDERVRRLEAVDRYEEQERTVARQAREITTLRAENERLGGLREPIRIIFDGPPSHESGRFVEVENTRGESIECGEWIECGRGLWELYIQDLPFAALTGQGEPAEPEPFGPQDISFHGEER
ncbi:MAG: hypothetical protein GY820_39390 [Gammaproteobacteria bacterium]|nr:hypothetical protein [Gammaproteobacteria bacterium]